MAAVAIAAAFNAMTWPQSRTITPSPVGTQPVPRDHDSADGDSPAGLATDRMRHHHLGGGPRSSASRTGAPADALVLVEPNSGFREPNSKASPTVPTDHMVSGGTLGTRWGQRQGDGERGAFADAVAGRGDASVVGLDQRLDDG